MANEWINEFAGSVVVCDKTGTIISMNKKACKTFEPDGGEKLIGSNLLDCHSQRSKDIIIKMMEEKRTNVYTIEKNGIKKLIYQAPWFKDDEYAGFIELSLEIPFEMPHFDRNR